MCCSSSSTKRGTTSVPYRNPDSTISAIRPSMSTLVSTTIVRVALGLLAPWRRRRRTRPAPSAAAMRSYRLATVRPIIPSPRNSEMPSGSQVPSGPSIWASGRPSSRPEQQPDEQAEDRRHELGGRQLLHAA